MNRYIARRSLGGGISGNNAQLRLLRFLGAGFELLLVFALRGNAAPRSQLLGVAAFGPAPCAEMTKLEAGDDPNGPLAGQVDLDDHRFFTSAPAAT